jgi:TIR domain
MWGGWDVFVSYGHEDAAWVRVLAANLHRAGVEVFLDEWELVAGVVCPAFSGQLN